MQHLLDQLQQELITTIPMTRHLGITVEGYDHECLILRAPLSNNINHKQTAFAGSLQSVTTLAGWSLLWLLLKERNLAGRIVIQDSECRYLRPVTHDFSAMCYRPGSEQVYKLEQGMQRKGIARIELRAAIYEEGQLAVSFKGRYVAQNDTGS